MVIDALFRLTSEIMDHTDLNEDLPDHYNDYVDTIINEARETHNSTSHAETPTVSDFLRDKTMKPLCEELSELVDEPEGQYSLVEYGVLTRRSRLDGALQQGIPKTIRYSVLYNAHDLLLVVVAADECTTR